MNEPKLPTNKNFRSITVKFVSSIILAIVFFIIITPTSLIMRLLGKNLLNLKKNNKKTYWIKNLKFKSKMKNQF
jgi:hypothetical protein